MLDFKNHQDRRVYVSCRCAVLDGAHEQQHGSLPSPRICPLVRNPCATRWTEHIAKRGQPRVPIAPIKSTANDDRSLRPAHLGDKTRQALSITRAIYRRWGRRQCSLQLGMTNREKGIELVRVKRRMVPTEYDRDIADPPARDMALRTKVRIGITLSSTGRTVQRGFTQRR